MILRQNEGNMEEAARVLGIAVSTANADWLYAKGWLQLEMQAES